MAVDEDTGRQTESESERQAADRDRQADRDTGR